MQLKNIILIAFLISGMAALIYEVVWFRPLQLVFGSSVYAISTILTAFLGGLALGSFLFSRYADKVKNPLMIYAYLELGIAIYGVLIIHLFNILPYPYYSLFTSLKSNFEIFLFGQFLLMFAVMLVPTTLMGGTWPMVNKAFVTEFHKLGKGVGELYSVNSFGAIIGSFAGGFLIIPLLGVRNGSLFAAMLNFIAAIIIFYFARKTSLQAEKIGD